MQKVLILLAFVFIGLSSFAQVKRQVPVSGETNSGAVNEKEGKQQWDKKKNKRRLLKELNLTKEQKLKVREIKQANKIKRDEILGDEALTEVQKQDKMKEIRKTTVYNLRGILSDEQKEKLKAIRKEPKE